MVSLKEYAKKHSISYEAVRKQAVRYREDLGEHLYKVDRTQYLDEEGEAFLDAKRASSPVVIVEHDKDERIAELVEQNEKLKEKIIQLQDMLISRDAKVMELQDKIFLLTAKPEPASEPKPEPEPEPQPEPEPPNVVQPEEKRPKKKWWKFWKSI